MKAADYQTKTSHVLNMFFIIETSDSMPKAFVEEASKMILDSVKLLSSESLNVGIQIKLSVLEFNSKSLWLNPEGPKNIENFTFERSFTSDQFSNIGAALTELNSKLSPKVFLGSAIDNYLPILFFISRGKSTDNYMDALEELRKNEWFKHARKVALAIGDDCDITTLANITGDIETIIKLDDFSALARIIEFSDLPASMIKN